MITDEYEEQPCEAIWANHADVWDVIAAARLGCPTPISGDDTTVVMGSRLAEVPC